MPALSYWFEAVPEEKRFPSLEGSLKRDVAIIGGGIAGLTTAYFLAKGGARVALLEQGTLGSGDSGFTTAFISHFLDNVQATNKAWEAADETIRLIKGIVVAEHLDCDFKILDSISFTKDDAPKLKSDFESLSASSSFLKFLEKPEASSLAGLDLAGAIHIKSEAAFHIRKYLLGLAKAIKKLGGEIFEESTVLNIDGGAGKIWCENGEIIAKKIVVATGLAPGAFSKVNELLTPRLTFVIGAKLPEGKALPEYLFWDNLEPYHYFRMVAPNILMLGGEDRLMREKTNKNPHDELAKFLSGLINEKFDVLYKWQGSIFMTKDSLPFYGVHPAYGENILFAAGFGGNGMTFGSLAGRIISDIILKRENKFTRMFSFTR